MPSPAVRTPTKRQANSHGIYTEDLVQTLAGPVLSASVSVSPYENLILLQGREIGQISIKIKTSSKSPLAHYKQNLPEMIVHAISLLIYFINIFIF